MRPFILLLVPFLLWSPSAFSGLDITAYNKLVLQKVPRDRSSGDPDGDPGLVVIHVVEFPERAEGLQDGGVYRFGQSLDFQAGGYIGYGQWRNELAKLAGNRPSTFTFEGKTELRYDATVWDQKRGPFWELIDFSDAEGVIGPAACKRVYTDFVRFEDKASRHPDPEFRASYGDWKKAFAMCSDGGAIVFH